MGAHRYPLDMLRNVDAAVANYRRRCVKAVRWIGYGPASSSTKTSRKSRRPRRMTTIPKRLQSKRFPPPTIRRRVHFPVRKSKSSIRPVSRRIWWKVWKRTFCNAIRASNGTRWPVWMKPKPFYKKLSYCRWLCPSFSKAFVAHGRVFWWLGHRALGKRCSPKRWPPNAEPHFSMCRPAHWRQSIVARVKNWCGCCSKWPGSMRRVPFSSMKLIRCALIGAQTPSTRPVDASKPNFWYKWMDWMRPAMIAKSLWCWQPPIIRGTSTKPSEDVSRSESTLGCQMVSVPRTSYLVTKLVTVHYLHCRGDQIGAAAIMFEGCESFERTRYQSNFGQIGRLHWIWHHKCLSVSEIFVEDCDAMNGAQHIRHN